MNSPHPNHLFAFSRSIALCGAILLSACSSTPDHPTLDLAGDIPRHYSAKFTYDAPTIDGNLDDRAWRDAPWTANFVSIKGSATSRPRYQSRAKMLWNRQYLFLGVWMVEPNLESVPISSLGFEGLLTFATRDAERIDYQMVTLEPGNRLMQSHYRDGSNVDSASNATEILGEVALSGTLDTPGDPDRGWWAEIAIPWSSLQQPMMATIPSAGDVIRVNFSRQAWAWSPHYQHDLHDPTLWGKVELVDE